MLCQYLDRKHNVDEQVSIACSSCKLLSWSLKTGYIFWRWNWRKLISIEDKKIELYGKRKTISIMSSSSQFLFAFQCQTTIVHPQSIQRLISSKHLDKCIYARIVDRSVLDQIEFLQRWILLGQCTSQWLNAPISNVILTQTQGYDAGVSPKHLC